MQVKNRGRNVEETLNRNINIIITHDCTVILGSTEPVKCQKPKTKELFQYEICPYRSNYLSLKTKGLTVNECGGGQLYM